MFKVIKIGIMEIVAAALSVAAAILYQKYFGIAPVELWGKIGMIRMLIIWIAFSFAGLNIVCNRKKLYEVIYKRRYFISIAAILFGVLLDLNGSSLTIWSSFIPGCDFTESGVILGRTREIRSDEWAIFTPMLMSQSAGDHAYSMYNELLRATPTNISMHYALPFWGLATVFRPFLWGFLILGFSRGLSFFWCARMVVLCLVSFEFGMILTEKRKGLSLLYSVLITLSPIVQWWFAINGLVEMLIFAQLSLIMLNLYTKTNAFWKKALYVFAICYCAGGFVMTIYPSWMVPVAYFIVFGAIWIIYQNRKENRFRFRDLIPVFVGIGLLLGSMYAIFKPSFSVIEAVSNTVYPGKRFETGGGRIAKYVLSWTNIFFAVKGEQIPGNQCESAVFFDLFPLGIVLSFVVFFREKKKDILLILMLVLNAFMSIWCIWGFPDVIAKWTFLSNSQPDRTFLIVGLIHIVLLIRALSLMEKPIGIIWSAVLSIAMLAVTMPFVYKYYNGYLSGILFVIVVVLAGALFYTVMRSVNRSKVKEKHIKGCALALMIAVMMVNGCMVNPVQLGTTCATNTEMGQEMIKINQSEEGNWIVEGQTCWPVANYPLLLGLPTLNCVNTYPAMERWSKLDPTGDYKKIYNRYAGIININVINSGEKETFEEAASADQFVVNVTAKELADMDVKYVLSIDNLVTYNTQNLTFVPLYQNDNYYIFKLESNSNSLQ